MSAPAPPNAGAEDGYGGGAPYWGGGAWYWGGGGGGAVYCGGGGGGGSGNSKMPTSAAATQETIPSLQTRSSCLRFPSRAIVRICSSGMGPYCVPSFM